MVIQICEMCTGVRNIMCSTEQSGVLERKRERGRARERDHSSSFAKSSGAPHVMCLLSIIAP